MSLMETVEDDAWTDWASRKSAMNIKGETYDGKMQMLWKTRQDYARWLKDLDIRDRELHGAQNKID